MLTARKYRNRASKLVILSIGSRREGNAFDLPVRARSATVLSLRPLCFSVEPSRSAGERDGLQIKGIAQNSCRARFDAHSKCGTESSNPPPSSGESANFRSLADSASLAVAPFERGLISERIKDAKANLRRAGKHQGGGRPFGWQFGKVNGAGRARELIPDPDEQAANVKCFESRG